MDSCLLYDVIIRALIIVSAILNECRLKCIVFFLDCAFHFGKFFSAMCQVFLTCTVEIGDEGGYCRNKPHAKHGNTLWGVNGFGRCDANMWVCKPGESDAEKPITNWSVEGFDMMS